MSILQARIPDLLLQQVNELAANENVAVDEVGSAALAAHVCLEGPGNRLGASPSRELEARG